MQRGSRQLAPPPLPAEFFHIFRVLCIKVVFGIKDETKGSISHLSALSIKKTRTVESILNASLHNCKSCREVLTSRWVSGSRPEFTNVLR